MNDEKGKLPFIKIFTEAFLGVILDDISLFCNLGSRECGPF
jgi:hypothetical protein